MNKRDLLSPPPSLTPKNAESSIFNAATSLLKGRILLREILTNTPFSRRRTPVAVLKAM